MMYKIHGLDDPEMVKWAKIAFYQLQEKEIQECSDILALVPYHPKMVNMYGYTIF